MMSATLFLLRENEERSFIFTASKFFKTERMLHMKKLLCLLLVFVMCLSLCACGKKEGTKTVLTEKTVFMQNQKEEEGPTGGEIRNEIKFVPEKVVAEDENVKIALQSFSEVYLNYTLNPRWVATCSVKVYNKTNENIYAGIQNTYINEDKVSVGNGASNGNIKGGKSEVITFNVELEAGHQNVIKSYTAEDLYDLEGDVTIRFSDRGYTNDDYSVPFNFSHLKK